jgi:hypothetical protein
MHPRLGLHIGWSGPRTVAFAEFIQPVPPLTRDLLVADDDGESLPCFPPRKLHDVAREGSVADSVRSDEDPVG